MSQADRFGLANHADRDPAYGSDMRQRGVSGSYAGGSSARSGRATTAPVLIACERAEHIAEWVKLTGEKEVAKAQVAPSLHTGGRANKGINAAVRELGIDRSEAQRAGRLVSWCTLLACWALRAPPLIGEPIHDVRDGFGGTVGAKGCNLPLWRMESLKREPQGPLSGALFDPLPGPRYSEGASTVLFDCLDRQREFSRQTSVSTRFDRDQRRRKKVACAPTPMRLSPILNTRNFRFLFWGEHAESHLRNPLVATAHEIALQVPYLFAGFRIKSGLNAPKHKKTVGAPQLAKAR
jgi:hypothetical protein